MRFFYEYSVAKRRAGDFALFIATALIHDTLITPSDLNGERSLFAA